MSPASLAFSCTTCEMPIIGMPEFHVGLPFCCAGCVANGPCTCSYDVRDAGACQEPGPGRALRQPSFAGVDCDDYGEAELDEPPFVRPAPVPVAR